VPSLHHRLIKDSRAEGILSIGIWLKYKIKEEISLEASSNVLSE
jgi:hypothetical protein